MENLYHEVVTLLFQRWRNDIKKEGGENQNRPLSKTLAVVLVVSVVPLLLAPSFLLSVLVVKPKCFLQDEFLFVAELAAVLAKDSL